MKKNFISAFFGASISVGIFLLAYFFLDAALIDKFLPSSIIEVWIYFPTIFIAPFAAVVVHELGHLCTGLYLGQKFKLFVVAFLGIQEDQGKIKIFLNKNLAYFGGIVAVVPKKIEDIKHENFAKIIIAGPVASLLFALLCGLVFLYSDNVLNTFFGLSALSSFGIFLATTLPSKSGLMFTDRKRFQRLNQKGTTQNAEVAMYAVISQSIIENSFKNIDINKTYLIEKDDVNEMKFWAEYIRFQYYSENEMEAEKKGSIGHLQSFKNSMSPQVWKSLMID